MNRDHQVIGAALGQARLDRVRLHRRPQGVQRARIEGLIHGQARFAVPPARFGIGEDSTITGTGRIRPAIVTLHRRQPC